MHIRNFCLRHSFVIPFEKRMWQRHTWIACLYSIKMHIRFFSTASKLQIFLYWTITLPYRKADGRFFPRQFSLESKHEARIIWGHLHCPVSLSIIVQMSEWEMPFLILMFTFTNNGHYPVTCPTRSCLPLDGFFLLLLEKCRLIVIK